MATPQLSPGVLTREVDLTVGRAENVLDNIGGIGVAPPEATLHRKLLDSDTSFDAARSIGTRQALADERGKGGVALRRGGLETSEVPLPASASER